MEIEKEFLAAQPQLHPTALRACKSAALWSETVVPSRVFHARAARRVNPPVGRHIRNIAQIGGDSRMNKIDKMQHGV